MGKSVFKSVSQFSWLEAKLWELTWSPGSVFCLLLWVCSCCAQPITGQVTSVTWPAICWAQTELTPRKRQKTVPDLVTIIVVYIWNQTKSSFFPIKIVGETLWSTAKFNNIFNDLPMWKLRIFTEIWDQTYISYFYLLLRHLHMTTASAITDWTDWVVLMTRQDKT